MPRTRRYDYSPQSIREIWRIGSFTSRTTGFIERSGGYASITDVSHPGYQKSLGSGDCGGPMVLHRTYTKYTPGLCFSGQGAGSAIAGRVSGGASSISEPLASTLYGYGGTAIARTIPTNPAFDGQDVIAQSIGRDAIPKAIGASFLRERALYFRSLGKEYLNVQFGWLPFVDDIRDLMHAVINSDKILRDLRKGSDHGTRVGYGFPRDTSHSSSFAGSRSVYSVNSGISGWDAGSPTYDLENTSEIWFNGVFRYHVPIHPKQMSASERYAQYAEHVLGIRPTLEAVWDAAPWSWLADWALNVGDVAHNISAMGRDGLILQYGYIMNHITQKETHSWPGGSNCRGTVTEIFQEWKVRYPASPYGFGLTYDGLTAGQKSILAAIGISHF